MALRHFLLIYNIREQRIEDLEQFGEDAGAAAERYAELEGEHRGSADYEIVLIGADSIETIRTTHSHYFDGKRSESPFLAVLR